MRLTEDVICLESLREMVWKFRLWYVEVSRYSVCAEKASLFRVGVSK